MRISNTEYIYIIILFILTSIIAFLYWRQAQKRVEPFQSPIKSGSVYVFYHIYCNKNTEPIVRDQLTKMLFSNLYQHVDKVYCSLTGDQSNISKIKGLIDKYGAKFKVMEEGPGDKTYERFTLLNIRKYIKPEDKFLYIHSKGISNKNSENNAIYWWRTYMEYFLFTKASECINDLNIYDIIGLPISTHLIGLHFSGNFWWSTGKYYLSLADTIGDKYNDPESYIFTGNPKYKVLDENRFPVDGNDPNLYKNILYPNVYIKSAI
jgi:hypothetical protein